MRGCLFVLVAALVVLSAAAWFGSPLLASAAIDAALRNGGFEAVRLDTTATADPPPRLLLGHADRVRIVASDVSFRTFHADRLDLTLTDVDVVGRTAATIHGTISGAEVATADGVPTTADVTIDGDAGAAPSTIRIDGSTVDRVVRATLGPQLGGAVSRTELVGPDILRIVTPAATLEGQIVLDGSGGIALRNRLGQAPILTLDPSFPLRLGSVAVVDGALRIDATLDAEALFGA
jgi:hypothetical protein